MDTEPFTFIHCMVDGVRKPMLDPIAVDGVTDAVLCSSDAAVFAGLWVEAVGVCEVLCMEAEGSDGSLLLK